MKIIGGDEEEGSGRNILDIGMQMAYKAGNEKQCDSREQGDFIPKGCFDETEEIDGAERTCQNNIKKDGVGKPGNGEKS